MLYFFIDTIDGWFARPAIMPRDSAVANAESSPLNVHVLWAGVSEYMGVISERVFSPEGEIPPSDKEVFEVLFGA